MKNLPKLFLMTAAMFWLSACTHTSEAKVTVVNKGTLQTYVSISYSNSKLDPGQSDTFTLSWPGRGTLDVYLLSYPVGQPVLAQNTPLELNDGDEITVDVEFTGN